MNPTEEIKLLQDEINQLSIEGRKHVAVLNNVWNISFEFGMTPESKITTIQSILKTHLKDVRHP